MNASDPKTLVIALLGGLIPSLVWLWFWLKEDQKHSEPNGLLAVCFFVGMIAVIFVLPVEQYIRDHIASTNIQMIGWASVEEIIKYVAVMIVLYKIKAAKEPIDWAILFITTALGFAALENTLFLLKPISLDQTTVGLLTGNLRFIGATLLHTVCSGLIGIAMGLSFFMPRLKQNLYIVASLFVAITLHSVFNFFIMKNNGNDFLRVFGFLWVVTIIVLLLFEKLRRMSGEN